MEKYNPTAIPGVVLIAHDLYTKSAESLTALTEHLTKAGYIIKDESSENLSRDREKPPRSIQEKEGWALWYATLDEKIFPRKGECNSCKTLGELDEMWKPDYQCKGCGKLIAVKADSMSESKKFKVVRLFGEKRYNVELLEFHIPDYISIYEAWHWSPLKPGPDLYQRILGAAHQVARKDFYYQDGSPAFDKIQLKWMFDFIDNFTTLSSKRLKPALLKDLSGPGFIDNLARLTGHSDSIPTEPNIGNALMFFGKVLNGRPVTQQEIDEGIKGAGLDDPENVLGRTLGDEVVNKVINAFSGPAPFQEVHQSRSTKKRRF